MAEVILMDFLAGSSADFLIIFVDNRKPLRTLIRPRLPILRRDQVSKLDPLFTRELFGTRCQRGTNFFGSVFPVADVCRK